MNKDTLTAELLCLAQASPDDPTRSKAARLRAVLPEVEAALAAGTSRARVLETLHAHGLEMTHAVFNTTLRRLRATAMKASTKGMSALSDETGLGRTPLPPAPIASLHNSAEPVDMDRLIHLGKQGKEMQ
ncbi:MAG: hypothetical protein WKG03_13260 [Telluria sp.]